MASDTLEKAKREMDEMLAGVMPESWEGHARLKIAGSELTGERADMAEEVATKLLENGVTDDAEEAARAAIKKVEEKV